MSRQSTALSRDDRAGVGASEASASDFDADTVDEFAVRNRISRSQVYKEIRAGRLVASKVNSRTIITRESGVAWRRALPKMPTRVPP